MKFFLVSLATIITIITALLLDYGAKHYSVFHVVGLGIIGLVLIINFIKFKLWGYIHQHYDLSDSYPSIAIFFPMIYWIAILKGDAIFEFSKLIGIMLILFGIYYMNKRKDRI